MLQAYINLLVIIYKFFRVADLTLKQYTHLSHTTLQIFQTLERRFNNDALTW